MLATAVTEDGATIVASMRAALQVGAPDAVCLLVASAVCPSTTAITNEVPTPSALVGLLLTANSAGGTEMAVSATVVASPCQGAAGARCAASRPDATATSCETILADGRGLAARRPAISDFRCAAVLPATTLIAWSSKTRPRVAVCQSGQRR